MSTNTAQTTLQYVSQMSLGGKQTKRFLGNPHISSTAKDNVLEHIGRIARLAMTILPLLQDEFHDNAEILNTLSQLLPIVIVHDDEEILQKADEPTFTKAHDRNNDQEIALIDRHTASLAPQQHQAIITSFISFRERKTLVGKIAKVLDNLVGNQIAIEEKIGLIQPDYAIACIEYVKKFLGTVCHTTDTLIQAQIDEILTIRAQMQIDGSIARYAKTWTGEGKGTEEDLTRKVTQQLSVDLKQHQFQQSRAYIPVWEY